MEMKIRETNGTFKVTVTSLAGQELAIYREVSGSLIFELREVEEMPEETEVFEIEPTEEPEPDDFELHRVPMLRARELALAAQEKVMREIAVETLFAAKEEAAVMQDIKKEAKNNALFHKLSALRRELATTEKVPPYLIFHDKTLWNMVEKMPFDLSSLGNISGVGKAKLEKYGTLFLSALQEGA